MTHTRLRATTILTLLIALTALALTLPPWYTAPLVPLAVLLMKTGRRGFLLLGVLGIALNVLLLALFLPGSGPAWQLGPIRLGAEGASRGLASGIRLAAIAGANFATLSHYPPTRILEDLRLPPRLTGLLAATLIAAQDVGRDFQTIRDARRLDGAWPKSRWKRIPAAATLLPTLMVAAHQRAQTRRDALRLAGHDTGPHFVPIVAIAALATAGRLAFVGLPNITLTYVVIFLGGLVYGARVGVTAAIISMATTDFLLTGLLPSPFANVPAMALVALAGATLRHIDFGGTTPLDRITGLALAATAGFASTLLFSIGADTATWLMIPELRGDPRAWQIIVIQGLIFNVIPALVNAALFAAAVGPVSHAMQTLHQSKNHANHNPNPTPET